MSGFTNNKIIVYTTTDNGDGFVSKIGEYDTVEEIEIRIGTFDKDVVISFEYETRKN